MGADLQTAGVCAEERRDLEGRAGGGALGGALGRLAGAWRSRRRAGKVCGNRARRCNMGGEWELAVTTPHRARHGAALRGAAGALGGRLAIASGFWAVTSGRQAGAWERCAALQRGRGVGTRSSHTFWNKARRCTEWRCRSAWRALGSRVGAPRGRTDVGHCTAAGAGRRDLKAGAQRRSVLGTQ